MSEPIIIEIPSPTRERLVLVPPDAVSRTVGGDELLTIRTANARDATPADLLRAVPSAEAWKAAHAEAERELIRARAAHLRADLRDAAKRAEMAKLTTRVATLAAALETERARAEKAERELRDMSERAGDAERERDEVKELARVLEVERDAALDARNACAAERNEARAEVERLTAPGEGEPTGARAKSAALALRHARAMKAVLLAAKAWGRSCRAENPSVDREVRMLAAVNRLAKIEKEVSR